jgi:hypothetical protein
MFRHLDEAQLRLMHHAAILFQCARAVDLLPMLRGQLLHPSRGPTPLPCQLGEPLADFLPLQPRDIPQPPSFKESPEGHRSRFLCPQQEHALAGEEVSCSVARKALGGVAPEDQGAPEGEAEFRPCRDLHGIADALLREFLGLRQDEPWPEGDGDPILLRAAAVRLLSERIPTVDAKAQQQMDAAPAGTRQLWLRFLLGAGRLSEAELREMIDHQIFTLEEEWLPCKDPQRDHVAFSRKTLPRVPAGRYACPLHVRALRGDRSTPCMEVDRLVPAAALVRQAVDEYPEDALKRRRPPRVSYWLYSDEQPGGPEDLVRQGEVRPCVDLGYVLAAGFTWLIERALGLMKKEKEQPAAAPAETP